MQKSVQARKNRIISTMNGQFQSGLPIFKTNRNTNRNLPTRNSSAASFKEKRRCDAVKILRLIKIKKRTPANSNLLNQIKVDLTCLLYTSISCVPLRRRRSTALRSSLRNTAESQAPIPTAPKRSLPRLPCCAAILNAASI